MDSIDNSLQEINFRSNVENVLYECIDSASLFPKKKLIG